MEKAGDLTEDQLRDLEGDIQKLTDRFVKSIDDHIERKEAEGHEGLMKGRIWFTGVIAGFLIVVPIVSGAVTETPLVQLAPDFSFRDAKGPYLQFEIVAR